MSGSWVEVGTSSQPFTAPQNYSVHILNQANFITDIVKLQIKIFSVGVGRFFLQENLFVCYNEKNFLGGVVCGNFSGNRYSQRQMCQIDARRF